MPPEALRSNLELARTVWRVLTRAQRRQLLWLQFVALLMSLSTLGGIAAIIPFFAVLADPGSIERHVLLHRLYLPLEVRDAQQFGVIVGCGFVVVVLLANAINLLGSLAISRFALRVGHEFHVTLYEEYLHRDYLFHVRNGSVVLMNNVLHEIARAVTGIIQGGMNLAASSLTCVFIVASIMWLNPWLAAGAALVFLGSYALIYFALRRQLAQHGEREAALWDALLRTLTESFGGIRDIQLRGAQPYYRDVFDSQCAALERLGSRMLVMAQSPRYVLECVMVALLVGAALWLQRGSQGGQWLAQLSFLAFAAYRVLPAMHQGYASLVRIRADRSAFQRIAGDLSRARAEVRSPPPTEARLAAWRGRPHLALRARNLSFRYSTEDVLAIRDVSLEIPCGALVGFVGANGSGKTTLADLLMGLLHPQTGCIDVDGVVLDRENLPAWRANVAHVPQQVFLFDASLRENIAPGVAADDVDRARLQEIIEAVQLGEVVASLPQGLEHRLGERALRLSGGQRQRVGIARALYGRASMLVLDEATSALDGHSERGIVATLAALRGRVTTIVIGHRVESVRDCDVIYEFERGVIVGRGDFAQLSRDSARFRVLTGARA